MGYEHVLTPDKERPLKAMLAAADKAFKHAIYSAGSEAELELIEKGYLENLTKLIGEQQAKLHKAKSLGEKPRTIT